MKKLLVVIAVLALSVSAFAAGKTLLVDNCDKGNSVNALGGMWCTYNDASSGGTSTVEPAASTATENPFVMTEGGADGKGFAAGFKGVAGTKLGWDFIGMICSLGSEASCPACKGMDVSKYTGVKFALKGTIKKGTLALVLPHEASKCNEKSGACESLTAYADYSADITSKLTDKWTVVKLDFKKDFAQPEWTKEEAKVKIADVLKTLHMLKWEYKSGNGEAIDVMVDDIELY